MSIFSFSTKIRCKDIPGTLVSRPIIRSKAVYIFQQSQLVRKTLFALATACQTCVYIVANYPSLVIIEQCSPTRSYVHTVVVL